MLTKTPEAVIGSGVQPIASAAEIIPPDVIPVETPSLVSVLTQRFPFGVRLTETSALGLSSSTSRLGAINLDTLSRVIVGSKGSERIRCGRGRRRRCSRCNGKHNSSAGECRGSGLPGSKPPIYVPFKVEIG